MNSVINWLKYSQPIQPEQNKYREPVTIPNAKPFQSTKRLMKKLFLFSLILLAGISTSVRAAYWQQFVHFEIDVRLDDEKNMLYGFEKLTYVNNSPDQLSYIYMHIWPNAYRDNNTALGRQLKENGELFFYYAKDEDRGYIDSLNWEVDGQMTPAEIDFQNPDIVKLILAQPLMPGGQVVITTPFRVKIPSGKISRMGHIGQQYQITQWYPKPAVYDVNGWNPIPYLDQGEFYSEYGTYDVNITLPKNYILGATGDIVDNPEEVAFMNEQAAKTKDIKEYDKKDDNFPASSVEMKTVHFHQENVHDFAWFCDKRYHVLKGEVELPHTGRKVTTWVLFTNQYAFLWKDAIEYVNDALFYYSKWNGDYEYKQCTAVDGALSAGGGMEYPNITVIGAANSPGMLETVIMHEVGHNWFYGMLGSNERQHAWMDEGINSANELRYNETKYPGGALVGGKNGPNGIAKAFDLSRYHQKAQYYQLYALSARQGVDQPCEMHATKYTTLNYGAIVYSKTAVVFDYLRGYLGDSLYDKCFQTYFDRWHFKHPQPSDIRSVFEEVANRNLSWFFDDMLGTTKKLDYKVTGIHKKDGAYEIDLKNVGEINAPVCVSAVKDGQVVKSVWYEGFAGESHPTFPMVDADEFIIDQPEDGPDVNRKNNTIRSHGLLKKTEPLKFQFLGSLDNPSRTQLFFTPTLGYNYYDQFMLGAAFYNHFAPGKHFEWLVMPMYGFGSKKVVGHADAYFNFFNCAGFQNIRFGVNASQYDFYKLKPEDNVTGEGLDRTLQFRKVAPELDLTLRKKDLRSPITNQFAFRYIMTQQDAIQYNMVDSNSFNTTIENTQKNFFEAKYTLRNNRHVNPWSVELKYQMGDDMSKLSMTANYTVNYADGKGFHFRLFGGTFLDATNAGPYRWRMSGYGTRGIGNHDYLYDNIFLGRSEETGFLAAQFAEEEGAFKVYSPVGQSNSWLAALNVKIDLPVKSRFLNKFKIYGDFGTAGDGMADQNFLYNAGVQFSLFRSGICDVYFPIIWSQDIKDYYTSVGQGYGSMIRFTFNLNRFAPSNISNLVSLGF